MKIFLKAIIYILYAIALAFTAYGLILSYVLAWHDYLTFSDETLFGNAILRWLISFIPPLLFIGIGFGIATLGNIIEKKVNDTGGRLGSAREIAMGAAPLSVGMSLVLHPVLPLIHIVFGLVGGLLAFLFEIFK